MSAAVPIVSAVARPLARSVAGVASGGASSFMLDDYTAAHAYSLRRLRADYSGAGIRVRRSSDNAEQDIGFSGEGLDQSALTAFTGAGDGFVATWYDQVGSNDLTQATSTKQPQIVASGAVVTDGSRPAMLMDGDALANASVSITQPDTAFIVYSGTMSDASAGYALDGVAVRQTVVQSNNNLILAAPSPNFSTGLTNRDTFSQAIDAFVFDGASTETWQNGSSAATGSTGTGALGGLTVGARAAIEASNWAGKITEVILFADDQGANVATLSGLMNDFYAAY